MNSGQANVFNNASAYEAYVGRWSRLVGRRFVTWLGVASGAAWLDVGAGTGILTQVILDQASPKKIVAIDLSEHYLAYARQVIQDDRVEFKVADAGHSALEAPEFDVAVAGLVLNFVPSPDDAVRGMKEAVRAGCTVAAYVWDYGDRMEMMRHFWDAAAAVDPSSREQDAGAQFTLCDPDHLLALFVSAGLKDIDVTAIDVQTTFLDFDDFWTPFLGAQGSVSKYLRSLDDDGRAAIRARLVQQLPIQSDKTIPLTARAWAIKGTR